MKTVTIEIKAQTGGFSWNDIQVFETLDFELTTYEETYKKVNEHVQALAKSWNVQMRWNYKDQLQGYYVNP